MRLRLRMIAAAWLMGVCTSAAAVDAPAGGGSCDTVRGERVFAKCAICHSREPAAPSPAGPSLHGVVGRTAGTLEGFAFSKAMRSFARPWTSAELDRFLAAPATVVPGTTMAFAGLRNSTDRAAVICLLERGS